MKGSIPKALPEKEINKLFEEYRNGDLSAREKIINHNIRLVTHIVRSKFGNVSSFYEEDLEATGLQGLIKAVDRFDVDKDFKFATFAAKVITNEILMLLRKDKGKNDLSLDDIINVNGDGDELKLGDIIIDEKANFDEKVENEEILKLIRNYVFNMEESKEKQCIIMYFGFNGKKYKQREIAKILGLSQSYVVRIIQKILKIIGNDMIEMGIIDHVGKKQNDEEISLDKVSGDKHNFGRKFKNNKYFNIIKNLVIGMPYSKARQAIIMYCGFEDKSYSQETIAKFLGISKQVLLLIMEKFITDIDGTLRKMNIKDSEGNDVTLSSFYNFISSERKGKWRTIYVCLKTTSKTMVKSVIDSLNDAEKELFYKMNGHDLGNPKCDEDLTIGEMEKYYQVLIPKMLTNLDQLKHNGLIIDKEKEIINLDKERQNTNMVNIDEILKDNNEFKIVKELILTVPDCIEKQALMMYLGFDGNIYTQRQIAYKLLYDRSSISYMISKISKKIDEELKQQNIKDKDGNYITVLSFKQLLSKQKTKREYHKINVPTVYEQLHLNDKNLINIIIDNLNEEEKDLFERRNGQNLDNPVLSSNWTLEDDKKYNGALIPKMEKILMEVQNNISNKEILDEEFTMEEEKKETVSSSDIHEENNEVMPSPHVHIMQDDNHLPRLDDIVENDKLAIEQPIEPINDKNNIGYKKVNDDMYEIDELINDDDGLKKVKEFILAEPDFTEKQALVMYLGLNGKAYSQKEIAERFGCSASNISHMIGQLSTKIDVKLRRNNIKYKNGICLTVSIFKKILNKQRPKKSYHKINVPTVYEQLHLNDKTLINRIIDHLNEEEKDLFERRNGQNLDNPVLSSNWTLEDDKKYNSVLIPKMEKILMEIQNDISNKEISDKEFTMAEEKKETVSSYDNKEKNEAIPSPNVHMMQDDNHLPRLDDMVENVSLTALIVRLKLGLLPNNKTYTTEEISKFLNISTDDVIAIVKNALILYKQGLNNFIDELIDDKSGYKK